MSQLSFESLFMTDTATAQIVNQPPVTPPRMLHPDEARREFIRVFRHLAPYMRRLEVFRDFVSLAARELDMARVRSPENIGEISALPWRQSARQGISGLRGIKAG